MSITEMLAWQWQGYISYHQSRVNLVIHWLAVPLFITATFTMFLALIHAEISNAILAGLAMAIAMLLQGFGHAAESLPVQPFKNVKQAVLRVLLEQFVTFSRFLWSGNWWLAYQASGD